MRTTMHHHPLLAMAAISKNSECDEKCSLLHVHVQVSVCVCVCACVRVQEQVCVNATARLMQRGTANECVLPAGGFVG